MGPLFLTGAGGFLGRRLLAALRPGAAPLTCLVRDPGALAQALDGWPGARAVRGELADLRLDPTALRGAHTILHLAASTGKAPRARHRAVNVAGTRALVQAAKQAGVPRIIFVSSIAAGFSHAPFYHYAATKRAAEALVRESGLDFAIIRPTMIFGPGSPVARGLATLASAPVGILFGDGSHRVQPIHVDDLARLLADLAAEPSLGGRTIEAGGPDVVTLDELFQRLSEARTGRPGKRLLHLPLEPLRTVLGLVEPLLLPVLPLTAGQLATFANEGTAASDPFTDARRGGMRPLAAMIAESR